MLRTPALPGLSITLSSEVSPEIREYERLSTACANAYVQTTTPTLRDSMWEPPWRASGEELAAVAAPTGSVGCFAA